jgi:hypothetical protein
MNHRDQARYAVATAIDTFRFKPTKVPWEPKLISRGYRPKAFTLIKTYPGYTVARKWGLGVVVKQDDGLSTSTLGCFNVANGRQDITMRVTNLAVWLHELCHAASYRQDWRIHQELVPFCENLKPAVERQVEMILEATDETV